MTKRALLIGFNYRASQCPLQGCWNDVQNIYDFLKNRGYLEQNIEVITDANFVWGKENVIGVMIDFIEKVKPGDQIFFHFSGHGGQLPDGKDDVSSDEKDGMDECIYADDLEPIRDDVLNQIFVKCLPEGASLVAILDCCHSGTGLDLRYTLSSKGVKEENFATVDRNVVCISACEDYDTAADTSFVTKGKRMPQGALTHSFIEAMTTRHFRTRKWMGVLEDIISKTKGYHQIAQLSSTLENSGQSEVSI